MHITDLKLDSTEDINQAGTILVAFREYWPDVWPNMESDLEEVRGSFGEDLIIRVVSVVS